jgi:hypothetical protein
MENFPGCVLIFALPTSVSPMWRVSVPSAGIESPSRSNDAERTWLPVGIGSVPESETLETVFLRLTGGDGCDYSTGLIRILVQAQPRRVKLMAGKILALAGFTLLAATVTALVAVLAARPLARLEGIQVVAWKTDFVSHLAKGYFDFTVAVLV